LRPVDFLRARVAAPLRAADLRVAVFRARVAAAFLPAALRAAVDLRPVVFLTANCAPPIAHHERVLSHEPVLRLTRAITHVVSS